MGATNWGMIAQAGGQVAGGLMGMFGAKAQQRKQFEQQQQLMNQQYSNQRQLNEQGQQLGKDMWDYTNYENQRKHMEKAGLNVGLMYEGGGAGGSTTTPSGGGASGGNAPAFDSKMMDIGMQAGKSIAELDLIKAQTEKIKAETAKTAGVDTTEAETRIESLTQGIENQKATETLTKVQTRLGELNEQYEGESMEDRLADVRYTAQKVGHELNVA